MSNGNKQEQYYKLYRIFELWLSMKEEKKYLANHLKKIGISKIAVYGCGKVGEHLAEELRNSDVEIMYFIDKNADPYYYYYDWQVISPQAELEFVDTVINTVTSDEKAVTQLLKQRFGEKIKVFHIMDLLGDCMQTIDTCRNVC